MSCFDYLAPAIGPETQGAWEAAAAAVQALP